MSPQLTLSSLFCTLALGMLCVVTSVGDLVGVRADAISSAATPAPGLASLQAEASPGLLP